MNPGRWDTRIFRGTIWRYEFIWKDGEGDLKGDFTGYTVEAHFEEAGSGLELDVSGTVDGPAAKFTVKIEETVTPTITWDEGSWHLTVTDPSGDPIRLLEGLVSVR